MRPRYIPTTSLKSLAELHRENDTVSEAEWGIADTYLRNQPPGAKLRCYTYDSKPLLYRDFSTPLEGITLSCSYIFIKRQIFAITKKNSYAIRLQAKYNVVTLKSGNITLVACEWEEQFASSPEGKVVFNYFLEPINRTPYHKMPRLKKNPVILDSIPLKHSFIKVGDQIYALGKPGFEIHSAFSKTVFGEREDKIRVALKIIRKWKSGDINTEEAKIASKVNFLIAETKKLGTRHPVYVFQVYDMDLFHFYEQVIFHSETVQNGIHHVIAITKALHGAACALQSLHDQNILHRDIKPDNILINTNHNRTEVFKVTIADFGFSKETKTGQIRNCFACGTPGYLAPEINPSLQHMDLFFSFASDVFAFGRSVEYMTTDEIFTCVTRNMSEIQREYLWLYNELRYFLCANATRPAPAHRILLPMIIQLLEWQKIILDKLLLLDHAHPTLTQQKKDRFKGGIERYIFSRKAFSVEAVTQEIDTLFTFFPVAREQSPSPEHSPATFDPPGKL